MIAKWLDYLNVSGKSFSTLRSYAWHVRQLRAATPGKSIEKLSTNDLIAYLARQRERGWSDSSVKLAVNAFRSFYAFTLGKRRSPARAVPCPRPKPRPQRTLNVIQAMAVIASCDTSTARGQRDLALLCLLLDTGLRSGEACGFELHYLNLLERKLLVRVKGGAVQRKVFTVYTASQLERWLAVRPAVALPATTTLFISVGGTKPGTPLTVYGMRCIFRSIAHAAGLDGFSPHDLRRSFATLAIKFGASTRLVQLQGGWEDLSQLERYTQALQPEDIEQYLPIGRLMGM